MTHAQRVLAGALILVVSQLECMSYLTHDRGEVLIYGVDIDQTLLVARDELEKGGWGSVLTLWAIRDQRFTPAQAQRASELYFEYVGTLERSFDVWHLTWAIANMYRHGGAPVKAVLEEAYRDAQQLAATTHGLADTHVNGDTLHMGDAHIGGRRYAQQHVVVPGNPDYLQSYEEYQRREEEQ
ncbi:MAG: hypothetical protein GF331_18910 [Chitinivibrionales bacterium]|nr:hypothetical protein [Chitinivibrionales bacterium]